MKMKTLVGVLLLAVSAQAQTDPTLMTVNGIPVSRSEFEYSYNKNNSEGVIDKKSVEEYVDLFVNYKLKVVAALDERIDTTQAFLNEFAQYRDQQIRPMLITDEDVETEARQIYNRTQHYVDSLGGLVKPAHILLSLSQKADNAQQQAIKQRADSIYQALVGGADFADMARRFSDDKSTAPGGGELPWIQPGQTVKAFEQAAYALKVGEMSKPVLSDFGYHIILLKDKANFFPYDSLRADIITFIERRGIKESIMDRKVKELATAAGKDTKTYMDDKAKEFAAKDAELNNLIREYHDGLLLFEISNREVWDRAAKDEAGLKNYFKKNKKKYAWEQPRFKGIAYRCRDKEDVKRVQKAIKKLPFDQWADCLRTTFNADSVLRIRVEKGIFKEGDNSLIDRDGFKKKGVAVTPLTDYPYEAVYGKVLKAPKEYTDVKNQVTADYQDELEKAWVESLRRRYPVTIDRAVLSTVNKH